jgi:hypothetical protein
MSTYLLDLLDFAYHFLPVRTHDLRREGSLDRGGCTSAPDASCNLPTCPLRAQARELTGFMSECDLVP